MDGADVDVDPGATPIDEFADVLEETDVGVDGALAIGPTAFECSFKNDWKSVAAVREARKVCLSVALVSLVSLFVDPSAAPPQESNPTALRYRLYTI